MYTHSNEYKVQISSVLFKLTVVIYFYQDFFVFSNQRKVLETIIL